MALPCSDSVLACFTTLVNGNTKIRNFPTYTASKVQTRVWNVYIKSPGDHLEKTYQRLAPSITAEQRALFADFDYTSDKIIGARTGDHGYFCT